MEFKTRIAGVTYHNEDGTDRQSLLKNCRAGERVELSREPNNPYDKFAISVTNIKGQILGYIPAGDSRLADHIDRGGEIRATVFKVTGGPHFFQRLFGLPVRPYGCVLEIVKGDFNWKAVAPWMDANRKIDNLIKAAHMSEKSSPLAAIAHYRDAVEQIIAMDAVGTKASAWRTAKYPIERLSLTLDKQGQKREALTELARWRAYRDVVGISDAEQVTVNKREARLAKATDS